MTSSTSALSLSACARFDMWRRRRRMRKKKRRRRRRIVVSPGVRPASATPAFPGKDQFNANPHKVRCGKKGAKKSRKVEITRGNFSDRCWLRQFGAVTKVGQSLAGCFLVVDMLKLASPTQLPLRARPAHYYSRA